MASIVFVKESCSTVVNGAKVRLTKDDAWDASDPVVKAAPGFFSDMPAVLKSSVANVRRPVEQATAAPGERRSTRKPAAKK